MNFRPNTKKAGFTLVEIMIVVLIIGILLAIAIPNFVSAREASRAKACVGNLKQIDSATQQYCMDLKYNASNYVKPTLDTTAGTGLISSSATPSYIRSMPSCPAGGTEAVAPTISDNPYCTISGTATNKAAVSASDTDSNYAQATATTAAGKFYHGL